MEVIQVQLNKDESIAFCCDIHMDSQTPSSRIDDIQVTVIDKIKDIREKCVERNVKHLFFEGDIFNRVACPHSCVNLIGEEFLKFKDCGIELYSILGNHDIVRNSLEAIEKSPIQTLFSFGVLKHINLNTRVVINKKVMVTPVDYTEYPPKASSDAKFNILLAHMFYDASDLIADERHNLSKKDIAKLKYDMVVLGHDHEEYSDVIQDDCVIIRSGSVLRGTSHNYNFTREPKFVVIRDIDNPKDSIEKVVIKHKPYKDIASEYVINKKQLSSITGLKDVLSNLAEKLAESSENDGDRIFEIIKSDPKLPTDCRALLLKYIAEST